MRPANMQGLYCICQTVHLVMNAFLQVEILEKEQEDNIIKCRCKKLGGEAADSFLFAFMKSSMSINTDAGCRMTVCSPWKSMQLQSTSAPLIFVYHARNM